MAPSPNGMPPLPPDVVQQQAPAPLRFMQQAGSASNGQAQQFNQSAFLEDRLNQMAGLMKDVADVLVITKPALMPILQKMIQAGSAIMSEIKTSNDGGDQPSPQDSQPPPQFAKPDSTAGAVSMG